MADLAVSERLLEHDRAALKSIHDYRRIERAIRFIDAHVVDQPGLEEVAREIGLSPFHAQRLFTRWAGISPKRFLGLLTVGHAKAALQAGESVLDATYEVGLSGPSRLHDLFVGFEAMTPGEYKQQGASLTHPLRHPPDALRRGAAADDRARHRRAELRRRRPRRRRSPRRARPGR